MKITKYIETLKPTLWHLVKYAFNYVLSTKFRKYDKMAGGAIDSTYDEKIYEFEDIVGSGYIELPSAFSIKFTPVFEQGGSNICVAAGSACGYNESAKLLGIDKQVDHWNLAKYIYENLDANIYKKGTWVYNGPKALQKQGLINSYTKVSIDQFKRSIYLGSPILTGTNKILWWDTGDTGVAQKGASSGHFILIVGYDDNKPFKGYDSPGGFLVKNTFGDDWGLDGYYWIPYSLAPQVLFNSKFSIQLNEEKLLERKNSLYHNKENSMKNLLKKIPLKNARLAVLMGITSGERPNDTITRAEVMAMIVKSHKLKNPALSLETAQIELERIMGK